MNFRRAVYLFGLGCLLLSGLTARLLAATPADPQPMARVHWLGLPKVTADVNSAHFMSVWRLPQTAALVNQTLDKMSRLPGHGATNVASALLRPLLDDLITSEFYLEVYATSNSVAEIGHRKWLLALRLPPDRARLWQANLPKALPEAVISTAGDWTVVGLGTGMAAPLPADFTARLRQPSKANSWLAADLTPAGFTAIFPTALSALNLQPATFNLQLTLTGDVDQVRTRVTLDFSQPLNLTVPAWKVPTNLLHQPLGSFTAVRGLGPWLATLPVWQDLQLPAPPNQVFFWSQADIHFQTFFAAPFPAATNELARLAANLAPKANPWLATHGEGSFQWQSNPPSLEWKDALLFSPFLKPIQINQREYILGGLATYLEGGPQSAPVENLSAALGTPNLLYYQVEQTGHQVAENLFVLQMMRMVFHRAQIPFTSPVAVWLKNAESCIGASTTMVTQTGRAQLTLARTSTVGFTALELHLLADWLESPQFPRGLHTFLAPPDKIKRN